MQEIIINELMFKKMKKRLKKSLETFNVDIKQSDVAEMLSNSLGFKNLYALQKAISLQKMPDQQTEESSSSLHVPEKYTGVVAKIYQGSYKTYCVEHTDFFSLYVKKDDLTVKIADIVEKSFDKGLPEIISDYPEQYIKSFSLRDRDYNRVFYVDICQERPRSAQHGLFIKDVYSEISEHYIPSIDIDFLKKQLDKRLNNHIICYDLSVKLILTEDSSQKDTYFYVNRPLLANFISKKNFVIQESIPEYIYEKGTDDLIIDSILDRVLTHNH